MVKVVFVEADGLERELDGRVGQTLMEVATKNNVAGIDADCGGACSCATCHVYVDEAWTAATGEAGAMEEAMLEFADGVKPESRLSCQIKITDALDGVVLRVPEAL